MAPSFAIFLLIVSIFLPTMAASNGRTCGTNFDDVPSRTVVAAVVFEGRLRRIHNASSSPSAGLQRQPDRHTVVFHVQKWHKGHMRSTSAIGGDSVGRPESVEVGYFGDTGVGNDDGAACVAPMVNLKQSYLVFLASESPEAGVSSSSGTGTNRPSKHRAHVVYRMSSSPMIATKRAVASVVEYTNCTKCGMYLALAVLYRVNGRSRNECDAPPVYIRTSDVGGLIPV
jgi:hypothetical protein